MRKIYSLLLIFGLSNIANAGFNGLTIHSRANCVNNESISWDATGYHMFATQSIHFKNLENSHTVNTGWENTWRSAGVHWNEALPGAGWTVSGMHWVIENNIPRMLGTETVTDCSIYDGWWDKDRPELVSNEQPKTLESFDPTKGPMPGSGIQVLPLQNVNIPESFKKKILANFREQKIQGFYFSASDYPKQLLNKSSHSEINNVADPYDTHLKKTLSLIKLSFPYKGIIGISPDNFIGYAAIGMWKNNGWTGIKEFFKDRNLGTCAYSLNNMSITNGAVQIPKEIARNDINNKITVIDISGNDNDSFLYKISWFDETSSHDFECANIKYDSSIAERMIDFAKIIDKNEII